MNKCICCGSIPKLKVCCNSCYQELKSKAEKLDRLKTWLDEKALGLKDFGHEAEWLDCINEIKKEVLENGKQ